MIEQLKTIRAGLETATCYSMLGVDAHAVQIALTALAHLEAMVGEQEPKFWYRPVGNDGLYEGPVHHNSIGGKMLRDEKPGEWVPLFEGAAPVAQQQAEAVPWDRLPGHLIDKYEGEVLTEELLQTAVFEVLQAAPQQAECAMCGGTGYIDGIGNRCGLCDGTGRQPQAEAVPSDVVCAVAAEREACARQCEDIYSWRGAYSAGLMCTRTLEAAAAAIRARGHAATAHQKGSV